MDTPEKQRKRKKLVERFDKDWELDLNTVEIKRKHKSFTQKIFDFFKSNKHTVFAMYYWIKNERLINENARSFYFPLKHDNIPVKGFPFKYTLEGTWSIPESDLKYLYGGPLIGQNAELLVPHEGAWKKMIRVSKNIFKILTPIITLVFLIVRYKVELFEIIEWIEKSL